MPEKNKTIPSAVEVVSASKPSEGERILFGDIPKEPVIEAINGICFDFNDGLRVKIPEGAPAYHLRFLDLETKSLIYDTITPANEGCIAASNKKYFIKFRLEYKEEEIRKHEKLFQELIFQIDNFNKEA